MVYPILNGKSLVTDQDTEHDATHDTIHDTVHDNSLSEKINAILHPNYKLLKKGAELLVQYPFHILSIYPVLNGKFQILHLTQQPDSRQRQTHGTD